MADKEKAQAPVEAELKKDALSEPAVEAEPEVVVEEVVEEVVEAEPVAVVEEVAPLSGKVVEVFEDKIVYLNRLAKKSMSVWQVQRRLFDLGYERIKKAKAGYFEEITLEIVEEFRADKKLGTGGIDAKFLKALFDGDKSVKLILA
jgi:hypothetical protein